MTAFSGKARLVCLYKCATRARPFSVSSSPTARDGGRRRCGRFCRISLIGGKSLLGIQSSQESSDQLWTVTA